MIELVAERFGETWKSVFFPDVHDFRPPPGGSHRSPYAVTELISFDLSLRRPVGCHVMHVIGAVMTDDVDELVDIDLGIYHD